jgi:hypothetical protein
MAAVRWLVVTHTCPDRTESKELLRLFSTAVEPVGNDLFNI